MLDPAGEARRFAASGPCVLPSASLTLKVLMIDLEFWKKPPASRPCLVLAGMHPAQSRAGLIP
jgi:hypothetical protein